MPELPEVETIRCVLEPQLAGRTIEAVEVLSPKIIAHPEAEGFAARLLGQRITGLSRRGKFLNLHLESGDRLALHLRMTGQPLVLPREEPVEKHTHLILSLSDGSQLRYVDVRRFGRFWLLAKQEADTFTGQEKLGLEPTDPALTGAYLHRRLGRSRKAVKEALHDQTVVAGIGNIYSDEILFAAGIFPGAPCQALAASDWEQLAAKIPELIRWGIDADRMTAEEYLRTKGREYRNLPFLRAYGRGGQPCAVCGSTIEKMTIGGRTSCYCPSCQRRKP